MNAPYLITTADQLRIEGSIGEHTDYVLAEGIYAGDFAFTRSGTEAIPLKFSAADGTRVKIDGSVDMSGAYITLQNIEICYTGWQSRQSAYSGANPVDIPAKDVTVSGLNCKLINCVLHDLRGVGLWTPAQGSVFYGCLSYHIGWNGTDRGHGHALYTQNDTPERIYKHLVLFACFGWNFHGYTESGAINNMTLIENTTFMAGVLYWPSTSILVGGRTIAQNPHLYRNNSYGESVNIGYNKGASDVILADNYFPSGIAKVNCTIASETGNFYGPAPVSGQQVYVWPNIYQAGRGLITIYNWDNADSISVDVSNVLSASAGYRLRNVQDYYADIASGVVGADGAIAIDMRAISHTVSAVLGGWPSEVTTFPTFGCFVIEAI